MATGNRTRACRATTYRATTAPWPPPSPPRRTGRGGRARTGDLRHPMPARYQAALHPDEMVGVVSATGLEPATLASQMRCATTCATPRRNFGRDGRRGATRTRDLRFPKAVECLAFLHAGTRVNCGGRSWLRTSDIRLIKTVLYLTELYDRECVEEGGSPRRPRTAALLVNSQALYQLSYRGLDAGDVMRR